MDAAIKLLDAAAAARRRDGLAAVLVDAVAGGASVSFMAPFGPEAAAAFWRGVEVEVVAGRTALFAALDGERVLGTVQLKLAMPPNQPHRAEIAKMLVLRSARRRGLGRALMQAAEAEALRRGKTLIVLDTASDAAERLYAGIGYVRVGAIPDYALFPDGRPCATTIFYKRLA